MLGGGAACITGGPPAFGTIHVYMENFLMIVAYQIFPRDLL